MGKYDQAINDWCERFEKAVAEEARRILVEQAAVVMEEDYYGEYEPEIYDRLKNFKDNSYLPYLNGNEGGVIFSSGGMSDYPKMGKGFTKESIFESNMGGEHGGMYSGTSPYESLKEFAGSMATLSRIADVAAKKAGKIF